MSPSGEDAVDGPNCGVELQDSSTVDDGQWEDYTCQGSWEDFIRALEGVLRDWKSCNTDLVVAGEHRSSTSPPPPASFSRCLEHDGQLFSIQLVPNPERATVPVPAAAAAAATTATAAATTTPTAAAAAAATTADKSRTASAACQLENRRLDFASDGEALTRLHRWFGLTQFVLLRALGKNGSPGMTLDQLLWATTVAAGNCKCSVPMLVSCDWNGLDCERSDGGGGGGGGAGGGEMRSGASCKGYSAPGSEGVACSVLFQTEWTAKPPPECLYLDGLTDLFLSKIRDAHCLPGRAFAPRVYAAVQQSWEWAKPETETPIPPGLPWDRAHGTKERSGSTATAEQGHGNERGGGSMAGGELGTTVIAPPVAETLVTATVDRVGRLGGKREGAVRRLLGAAEGGKERTRLWGPDEDPLLSICLRVRWTDLREGLVEESQHYTTLNPLPGGGEAVFGGDGGDGGSAGQWFVTPRWKVNGTDPNGAKRSGAEGCLGDACCRLLAALVLTTTMHPGTLIADLGADPMSDSPMAVAKDYGKAASAMLSADTRASVEELCSKDHPPSINHDEIDTILRHLLQSAGEQDEAEGEGLPTPTPIISDLPAALSAGAGAEMAAGYQNDQGGASADSSAADGLEGQDQTSKWTQVYPREQGPQEPTTVDEGAGRSPEGGFFPVPRSPFDGASEAWHPEARSTSFPKREKEGAEERDESLWAWAGRGGAPIGRLVSLLSLSVANCDDLGSMSLLWMSFVRDVRLLWEDGAVIPRMRAMPEVDGISMFDRRVSCTGQNLSVAAQLRGREGRDCGPSLGGLRSNEDGMRQGRGCGVSDGWRFSAEAGRLLPDTRMCLIWQKLQMLNCCRPDGEKAALASAATAAAVALSAAEPYSPQPSMGAAGGGGGDDDEEDVLFFDTREYCQTSEDEHVGGSGSDLNRDRGGDGCCGDDDPGSRSSDGGSGRSDGVGGCSGVDADGETEGSVKGDDDDLQRGEEGAPTGLSSSAEAPSDISASPPVEGGGLPTVAAADVIGECHNAVTVSPDVVGDSSVTDHNGGDDNDAGDARQGEECSVTVPPEAAEVALGAAESVESAEVVEAAGGAEPAEPAEAPGVAKTAEVAEASDAAGEDESPELPAPAGTTATTQQTLDAAATSAAASAAAADVEARDHHKPTDSARDNSEKLGEAESLERLDVLTGASPDQDSDTAGLPLPPARREGPTPAAAAAAPAASSPVAAARRLVARGPPRLLRTGGAVRAPRLPSSGPVTGDMLEQQTGQAGVYRWREVLVADMEAFRRENGSAAVFADFVRWYRPGCWQEAMPDGEWVQASDDRAGGAAEDDLRIAWPGQGQVLWRTPDEAISCPSPGVTRPSRPAVVPAPAPALSLATWLSCWADAGAAKENERAPSPLFCRVKEGEKALHYLETISPGPLLVQLLSALLGLSVFILEEACTSIDGLSAAKHVIDKARWKVTEAVELLASAAVGDGTNDQAASATATAGEGDGAPRRATPRGACSRPWSPFRSALIAADDACIAVKEAETALARTVSLLRSMPGERELADAAIGLCDEAGETPVVTRSQKEFLRDLLLAQGIHKTPGSELEDLLASYDEEHRRESGGGGGDGSGGLKDGEGLSSGGDEGSTGGGGCGGGGAMPPPITREYVLRCQTPAPFFSRNVGRGQMGAYPTPSSRMFAKTNGRHLRVALSLCESEI